jgi:predicted CxxxxCH...CXXCH cytochrome family protein
MRSTRRLGALLGAAMSLAALAACSIPRDREPAGQHPAGWADRKSSQFHGQWLRASGYPLADCRTCHGDDYEGGAVSSSCNGASCHAKGVEFCGTCHGGADGPRPSTGAHAAHDVPCVACHEDVPSARVPDHLNGVVDLPFAGLARANGAEPRWEPSTGRCADAYCHGAESPPWRDPPAVFGCDGCHGAPPASHARWARVAGPPASCASCHPAPPDARHLDGAADRSAEIACDACHGKGPLGAPPVALDGSTSPSARGVGAHARHLDPTLADRIGRVVPCSGCHDVPAAIDAPGHLDEAAPADVRLWGGAYDAAAGTCVVGCHWDRSPGPAWTDDSGAARACDGCHGFPPAETRTGAAHPSTPPDLAVCQGCHAFDPATHVDGHVDLVP